MEIVGVPFTGYSGIFLKASEWHIRSLKKYKDSQRTVESHHTSTWKALLIAGERSWNSSLKHPRSALQLAEERGLFEFQWINDQCSGGVFGRLLKNKMWRNNHKLSEPHNPRSGKYHITIFRKGRCASKMNWSNQYGLTGTASISLAHWARDVVSGLKRLGFRDRM